MKQIQLLDMPKQEFVANLARPSPPISYRLPDRFPRISKAKQIVLDLETYDPDLMKHGPGMRRDGFIVGIGINADNMFKEYFPLRHLYGPNCNVEKTLQWLREELRLFKGEIIGANSNDYDGDYLQLADIRAPGALWSDIQWAEPLLDEFSTDNNLDALARKYLGVGKVETDIEKLYGPVWKKAVREVHPGHLKPYVMGDIDLPFRILQKQKELLGNEGLAELFKLECRLNPMLLYMRNRGVRVDLKKAEELHAKFGVEVQKLDWQIYNLVGFEVNHDAAASMAKAFDVFNMKVPLTPKGNPSIKNEWLEGLGWKDWDKRTIPNGGKEALFARLLVEARELDRIRGTFLEGYILNSHINGRIHCKFHPLKIQNEKGKGKGTVTGRFSSSDPNLQNIPIHTALGDEIRRAFVPDIGKLWWSFDLSQIEYRFLVHFAALSKAPGADIALKKYTNDANTDYHKLVADMTGLDRNKYAKTLNFLLVFGGGKRKLAREIGEVDEFDEPSERALEIFEQYHKGAPYVQYMLNKAMEIAEERGYVKTILGRRGRFPLWESKWGKGIPLPEEQARERYGDKIQRSKTYKALNKIIQGSAADYMKTCMLMMWDAGLFSEKSPVQLSLTEHDELDGDFSPGLESEKILKQLKEIMESAIRLEVPVKADGGTGLSWAEAH